MSANTSAGKLRAVVDTNIFASGLIRRGSVPDLVLRAWEEWSLYQLVTSPALRLEVTDVLHRPKLARYRLDPSRIERLTRALLTAEQATPLSELPLPVRDPKDEKVLACALGGRVDYLVTGDDDLLALNDEHALGLLRVVSAREFLGLLGVDPGGP